MDLLMNGLLIAATVFAGGYCWVLARRVRDLKSLDKGLGGAIVTLTRQIELARTTLDEARSGSRETQQDLAQLVARAEGAAGQLRLLIAAAPVTPPSAPRMPERPMPERQKAEPAAPAPRAEAPARQKAAPRRPAAADLPELSPIVAIRQAPPQAAAPAGEPAQAPQPAPRAVPHLSEVPKPRALSPIENPLRRREPVEAAPAPTEDDLLEALSALAGGR